MKDQLVTFEPDRIPFKMPTDRYTLPVPADLELVNSPAKSMHFVGVNTADPATARLIEVIKNGTPEIVGLCISLIDCQPLEFDAIVDMLRDVRKIDEPRKAGSPIIATMLAAAGYEVKK